MGFDCTIELVNQVHQLTGKMGHDFRDASAVVKSKSEVYMNVKGISSINSGGIRAWILLMQRLKDSKIYYYECPKVFIDQVNMVNGFLSKNATIMSFYVPFYSEKKKIEKKVLLEYDKHYVDGQLYPLEKVYDVDGVEMEIDIIEHKYFKFIKDRNNI